jgi:hypothetical protein
MASNVAWGAFAVLAGSTPTVVTNVLCFLLNWRGWRRWSVPPPLAAAAPAPTGD